MGTTNQQALAMMNKPKPAKPEKKAPKQAQAIAEAAKKMGRYK